MEDIYKQMMDVTLCLSDGETEIKAEIPSMRGYPVFVEYEKTVFQRTDLSNPTCSIYKELKTVKATR